VSLNEEISDKMEKTSKKERVTGRVNVLSERERNNFCLPLKVTDTHRQRERERRRENKRDDVYDESQHHHRQSLPAKTQRAAQKAVEETPTNDQQEEDTNDEYKSDGEERRKERLEQRRTGRVRVSQEVRFYSFFFFFCDFFSEMRLRDKMRSFPPKPPCDAFEATREDDASICLFVCS
jgi:hypothetical protein